MSRPLFPLALSLLIGPLLALTLGVAPAQANTFNLDSGLRHCTSRPPHEPPGKKGKWSKKRNRLYSKTGRAHHSARDLVVVAKNGGTLEAKFSYGKIQKDVEGERVSVYMHTCGKRLKRLGRVKTDDEGWARLKLKKRYTRKPGVYEILFKLEGDASRARGMLWVLPKDARVAVFDIDGTLTRADKEATYEFTKMLGGGSYTPRGYPGGTQLTRAYDQRNIIPLYLSGRPYWFQPLSRKWLRAQGYAQGPILHTTQHRDMLPDDSAVGEFKLEVLNNLKNMGVQLVSAHGNAKTDIFAYKKAGIDPGAIFIIGDHGGAESTQPVRNSWMTLADKVKAKKLPELAEPEPEEKSEKPSKKTKKKKRRRRRRRRKRRK